MTPTKDTKSSKQAPQAVGSQTKLVAIPTAPRRDNFSVGDWRTALKQAENVTNPSRIKLYDIYQDILLDAHLIAVTEKRVDAVKSTVFNFEMSGKPNEAIDNIIKSSAFRQMVGDIVEARSWGHSAMWVDLSGGQWCNYKLLPRKHIVPETNTFIIKQGDRAGVDYSKPPYCNYVITAGETNDFGLLLSAVVWVLFKRNDIADLATFNELCATPLRKGKYPQSDEFARKELGEALAAMRANGFLVIPDTTDVEFVQGQASSNSGAYISFAEFCDKQLSKAFLRNTMTTDAEGGNYKGEVHQGSEMAVLASDRQFVLDILNGQFLRLLEIHGFNPGDGEFKCPDEDHLCLKDRVMIDKELNDMIEIDPEYFHEKYHIPVPKGGAKKKTAAATEQVSAMRSALALMGAQMDELVRLQQENDTPLETPEKPSLRRFFA